MSTKGVADVEVTEVDLSDPVTRGLFDLTSGRWPAGQDEVVVNEALTDKGYAVGDVLETPRTDVPDPTIVGIAESTSYAQLPGRRGAARQPGRRDRTTVRTWLVDGGPVSWAKVQELNLDGATRALAGGRPRPAADPAARWQQYLGGRPTTRCSR